MNLKKKKSIAVVSGGRSALGGSFNLSRALIASGYNVIYLSCGGGGGSFIRNQGFVCHDFARDLENQKDENGAIKTYSFFKWNRPQRRQSDPVIFKLLSLVEQYLDEHPIDLVLIDSNMTVFSLPFIKKKVPIITLNSTLSSFYFEGRFPVFSKITAKNKDNLLLSLKKGAFWLMIISSQLLHELYGTFESIIKLTTHTERMLWINIRKCGKYIKRSEYGVRMLAPEIVLGPCEIDFLYPESKITRYYAGFCVDNDRIDEDFSFNCIDMNQKLIYCSLGTCSHEYANARNFYNTLFKVAIQLNDYQFVIQEGYLKNFEGNDLIPSNVLIFNRVPQLELVKRAMIFITHAGFSSFREGVFFTTPMIAFPGWHDQFGNSVRIANHGLGLVGDMKKTSVPSLLSMILQVEKSVPIRIALQEMREKIIKKNELKSCVEFIENFIE